MNINQFAAAVKPAIEKYKQLGLIKSPRPMNAAEVKAAYAVITNKTSKKKS